MDIVEDVKNSIENIEKLLKDNAVKLQSLGGKESFGRQVSYSIPNNMYWSKPYIMVTFRRLDSDNRNISLEEITDIIYDFQLISNGLIELRDSSPNITLDAIDDYILQQCVRDTFLINLPVSKTLYSGYQNNIIQLQIRDEKKGESLEIVSFDVYVRDQGLIQTKESMNKHYLLLSDEDILHIRFYGIGDVIVLRFSDNVKFNIVELCVDKKIVGTVVYNIRSKGIYTIEIEHLVDFNISKAYFRIRNLEDNVYVEPILFKYIHMPLH